MCVCIYIYTRHELYITYADDRDEILRGEMCRKFVVLGILEGFGCMAGFLNFIYLLCNRESW